MPGRIRGGLTGPGGERTNRAAVHRASGTQAEDLAADRYAAVGDAGGLARGHPDDHGLDLLTPVGVRDRRLELRRSVVSVEGYRKDGPVAVALFELGEDDQAGLREARILRQREVNSVMEKLLDRTASEAEWR